MITDSTHPEVTVGALILNSEGKLLLVKSHKWNDQFVIPGGHVEVGEKIEDAVKREVKEETGLEVYDIKFVVFYECIGDKNFYKEKHFIMFDYSCRTDSSVVTLNDEGQEYRWVAPSDKYNFPVEHYTQMTINEHLK